MNRRILSGENTQIMLKQKNGETIWTLPYQSGESYHKLVRAERRQDDQRADAIKWANPVGWKYVNLYRAYNFLDIGDGIDLQELVNLLETARDTDPASGSVERADTQSH